jgi:hypothetical protein
MRNTARLLLSLSVGFFAPPLGAKPCSSCLSAASVADWRSDLTFLEAEIIRIHPNPFHAVTRSVFHAAFGRLQTRLPELTRDGAIVELMRIVALLHEGHSQIDFQDPAIGFHRFPLSLYQFKDGLFVRAATDELRAALGMRVVRIGAKSVEAAMATVRPLVQHDNDMTIRDVLPDRLTIPEVLYALGVCAQRDACTFEMETAAGVRQRVALRALPTERPPQWIRANSAASSPLPLYLHNRDRNFWFEPLPDARSLFVAYNTVADEAQETVAQFFDRAFQYAGANDVDTLILDLRWNNGGDNTLNAPLIRHLTASPRLNRKGHLYVLIGRLTFSAAMNCAMDLEKNTAATFVGEPTGSAPNQYGDATTIVLPHSRLHVRVSSKYWQDGGPADHRLWLEPDISVELTSHDYLENRDPALAAILERIKAQRNAGP